MSELTREMIRQHCLVLRDALGNLFPSIDDPSREYYWELLDELGKAALSALTARSEGFREGVETAAKVCEKRAQALSEDPNNGYVEGDTNAFIWTNLEAGYVAEELDEAAETIRVLSPRETDAGPQEPSGKSPGPAGNSGHKQNSPRGEPVRDVPVASAPSGEVAEMVKRLRECLSEHNRIRIAFLHNLERSVKPLEYETERQAFEALNNAAALLSKVVQGWVPVSKEMVDRFLTWTLPESVCADLIATKQGPGRTGTNLLSAIEARQMLEHVLKGEAK